MKESPFEQSFLDSQKEKLLAEKARLEGELSKRGTKKANSESDYTTSYQDYGTDEESNVAEYAQHETNLSVDTELEEELVRVNNGLRRLQEGTYGLDVDTGAPINERRLEAYPAAEKDIAHEDRS